MSSPQHRTWREPERYHLRSRISPVSKAKNGAESGVVVSHSQTSASEVVHHSQTNGKEGE